MRQAATDAVDVERMRQPEQRAAGWFWLQSVRDPACRSRITSTVDSGNSNGWRSAGGRRSVGATWRVRNVIADRSLGRRGCYSAAAGGSDQKHCDRRRTRSRIGGRAAGESVGRWRRQSDADADCSRDQRRSGHAHDGLRLIKDVEAYRRSSGRDGVRPRDGVSTTAAALRRRRDRLRHGAERLRVRVRAWPVPRHPHDEEVGRRRPGRRQPEDADHTAARPGRTLPLVRLHRQGLLPRPRRGRGTPVAVLRQVQDDASSRRRNTHTFAVIVWYLFLMRTNEMKIMKSAMI